MKARGLVAFDLDGTLIDIESSWRVIHRILGTEKLAEVNRIRYKRGEISYAEWAELDVKLWRGVPLNFIYERLKSHVRPMRNMAEALRELKSMGFYVGVLSAGVDLMARLVHEIAPLDFVKINRLTTDKEGKIAGVRAEVCFDNKGEILVSLAREMGVRLEDVVAVGDGENDISMFKLPIGLRIAFNTVSRALVSLADYVISEKDLALVVSVIKEWFRRR